MVKCNYDGKKSVGTLVEKEEHDYRIIVVGVRITIICYKILLLVKKRYRQKSRRTTFRYKSAYRAKNRTVFYKACKKYLRILRILTKTGKVYLPR